VRTFSDARAHWRFASAADMPFLAFTCVYNSTTSMGIFVFSVEVGEDDGVGRTTVVLSFVDGGGGGADVPKVVKGFKGSSCSVSGGVGLLLTILLGSEVQSISLRLFVVITIDC
jgi:hypothetical protein